MALFRRLVIWWEGNSSCRDIRETGLDTVMADTVIIGRVGVLHECHPILRSEDEHYPIPAAMRVGTPGFQGGSPLGVIHEPKGNVVVARHMADGIEEEDVR